MSTGELFTAGEAATRTGLTHDALRYYEREGLIGPVRRSAGGHRLYDEDDLGWIGLITCLREAGLGITDLRRFTQLLRSEDPAAPDRVTFLHQRRTELHERLTQTQRAITVLDDKIAHYSKHPPQSSIDHQASTTGQTSHEAT